MSLKFGTSGVRGLVTEMTDQECFLYTLAFAQYLQEKTHPSPKAVAIAGDYRTSTSRIMRAVGFAIQSSGLQVINCGNVATPAVAYYGLTRATASVMVTGSHIPDDRNGIKFNMPWGEVLKSDEVEIASRYRSLKTSAVGSHLFSSNGDFLSGMLPELISAQPEAAAEYHERFTHYFTTNSLKGLKIVFYQHSSVSRDILPKILEALGAEVIRVGYSDRFIPVDTESVENPQGLADWVDEHNADALVTTDGDGDRPLIVDETGAVLRGDVLGILVAGYLQADAVATPISCNTALEKSDWFSKIIRTRIGSPYVVQAMQEAVEDGYNRVVGYEANGGFLLASDISHPDTWAALKALPTRDAALPMICILLAAKEQGKSLSQLVATLPPRYTVSGLLRDFPNEQGHALVDKFKDQGTAFAESVLSPTFGPISSLDFTDGARITFATTEILHLRPSGNAPEFRCYSEADSPERAEEINQLGLQLLNTLKATD